MSGGYRVTELKAQARRAPRAVTGFELSGMCWDIQRLLELRPEGK